MTTTCLLQEIHPYNIIPVSIRNKREKNSFTLYFIKSCHIWCDIHFRYDIENFYLNK